MWPVWKNCCKARSKIGEQRSGGQNEGQDKSLSLALVLDGKASALLLRFQNASDDALCAVVVAVGEESELRIHEIDDHVNLRSVGKVDVHGGTLSVAAGAVAAVKVNRTSGAAIYL